MTLRKYLYEMLQARGYEVYSQGQITNPINRPYLVIKYGNDDLQNLVGAYQMVDIMCYAPDTSIFRLDDIVENLKSLLIDDLDVDEFTGLDGDYHDTTLKAYMRNLKFRVPHTII